MYACRAQNFFLVDLLVKHGAKIDAQDDNGWTPLSHASYNGCLKSVKKLLRHGADPIIHTIDYLYPFDLAKKNGHTEVTTTTSIIL
jgi:ankyrin repeat protein